MTRYFVVDGNVILGVTEDEATDVGRLVPIDSVEGDALRVLARKERPANRDARKAWKETQEASQGDLDRARARLKAATEGWSSSMPNPHARKAVADAKADQVRRLRIELAVAEAALAEAEEAVLNADTEIPQLNAALYRELVSYAWFLRKHGHRDLLNGFRKGWRQANLSDEVLDRLDG